MRKPLPQLGEAATALLRQRGISARMASIKTGIDRTTLTAMLEGSPPRLDIVEAFARAFGEDVNYWRELAGYETVAPPVTPADYFWAGVRRLSDRVGYTLRISLQGGSDNLTMEQAEALLAEYERMIDAGEL